MNRVHTAFFEAGDGAGLKAVLEKPIHHYGYVLFCWQSLPAIGAVAWEIDRLIEAIPPARRTHAIQACGALIGDIVEGLGGKRVLTGANTPLRKRVRGSTMIRSGSVWEFASVRPLKAAAERAVGAGRI